MFRSSKKISVSVSLVMALLLLFALGYLVWWLPEVVTSLINATDNLGNRQEITPLGRQLVLIDAYAMIAVAFVAVVFLFLLLRRVWRGEVFSQAAARWLAAVSWCCFAEGLLVVLLTVYFQLALGACVVACFVGLCLRVVKNVIEEATRIKSENDFTI